MALTLAILQVLLVRAGGHDYALPLHTVRETLQLAPESIQAMQQSEVVSIRDAAFLSAASGVGCSLRTWS